jgi:hypothetical protein
VAALALAPPLAARDVFVEGRAVVREGELVQASRAEILTQARSSLSRLMSLS